MKHQIPEFRRSRFRCSARPIRITRYRLGRRHWVLCRLWQLPCPGGGMAYLLEMVGPSMHRSAVVGSDRTRALSLYDRLVRGRASPCTLKDIVADELGGT